MLTKESFLSMFKRNETPKPIEVNGRTVYARRISFQEKRKISETVSDSKADIYTTFLVVAIGDENGQRFFEDGDTHHIDAMDPLDVSTIFDAAWDFNAMGQKHHDELKKSSENGAMNGSLTSSV